MVADGGEPSERGDGERSASPTDEGSVDPTDVESHERTDAVSTDETDGESTEPTGDGGVEPTDEEIVAAASEAAEGLVFSRYRRSDVRDVDVSVGFAEGVLSVDVYLNVPDADVEEHVDEEAERVADDAALAAIDAVDRLFEERSD